jgi:imidazole glycerol-phosphate synthase subunit HisH
MNDVVVVDYGIGNLKSIQRGLGQVGANVIISSNYSDIAKASHLVLPGVGAFDTGMSGLKSACLIDSINDFVRTGKQLLGICLGMQMLLEQSEEHGVHKGLGLISGCVKKIPENSDEAFIRKIPHIGWTEVQQPENQEWYGSCLEDIKKGEYFYFVHSFMAVPEKRDHLLALCEDEGLLVTAAVKRDNVTGLQFHPEKSGEAGLKVLSKFVNT